MLSPNLPTDFHGATLRRHYAGKTYRVAVNDATATLTVEE